MDVLDLQAVHFDVAARGELSKLIAAVGGVEMTIKEYPFAVSM